MLDTMTRPHNGRIPVGQRVGFAVEWHDRTQKIGMESRNAALPHQ